MTEEFAADGIPEIRTFDTRDRSLDGCSAYLDSLQADWLFTRSLLNDSKFLTPLKKLSCGTKSSWITSKQFRRCTYSKRDREAASGALPLRQSDFAYSSITRQPG